MIRAASSQPRFECRDAASGEDRDRQDVGRGETRLHQETAERGANLSDPIGVNEVALTQRDFAAFDSEQIDDLEMLPRLRHRRVIASNDQQHEVDAGRARYQAVDENARDRAHPQSQACRSLTSGDMPSRGRS